MGLLGQNLNHCRRANSVLFRGRYVKYPFENNLAALEKQDCYECLIGYLKADFPKPANFEEWMYYSFGQGIAEKYLVPYNRKIWKTEPREMGVEWVERIPRPPVENVVRSALGIATEGYVHQLFFRYPLAGGIEALVQAMIAPDARITCGFRVREVRREPGGWQVSDGRQTRRFEEHRDRHADSRSGMLLCRRAGGSRGGGGRPAPQRHLHRHAGGKQSVAADQRRNLHPRSRRAAPPGVLHGFLQPEPGPPRHLVPDCRSYLPAGRRTDALGPRVSSNGRCAIWTASAFSAPGT